MVSRIYLVNSDALDVILFLYFITGIFFFFFLLLPLPSSVDVEHVCSNYNMLESWSYAMVFIQAN